MDTVSKTLIESHWDGKYEVYEIKQFIDERGMVCETFRLDDDLLKDSKMCYISETEPFVMRGPHEHLSQTDFFVNWKTQMVYQMYNNDTSEMKYFITEPDKIYLIKVAPPIIHSYRNIDLSLSRTLNYPTSFFMGENKQEKIDEIRHEPHIEDKKVVVLFGAKGRLGSAMVEESYKLMGYHDFLLIPLYQTCNNKEEVDELFISISKQLEQKEVIFINCAGKTNVQDLKHTDELWWSNCDLPLVFAKWCELLQWKFIQFSSDYIFQNPEKYGVNVSTYTKSKQQMEDNLKGYEVLILRVANLFSTKQSDIHNIIYKMWLKVKMNQVIKIDPQIRIFPTDVNILAREVISRYIKDNLSISGTTHINIVSKKYSLKKFLRDYFNYDKIQEKTAIMNKWYEKFEKDSIIELPKSDKAIKSIINNLKENYHG